MNIVSIVSNWLNEAWNHKNSVLGGILALLSLSMAHYVGFSIHVPLQIVTVAGLPLIKNVTATFLFYVFFTAVIARISTSILLLFILPAIAASDRLGEGFKRKMSWPHQRRFVRSHTRIIKWEGYLGVGFQVVLFLALMFGLYTDSSITWTSGLGVAGILTLVILSGLVRAGFFLQPKSSIFVSKIKRSKERASLAASAALVTGVTILLIASFVLGVMRMTLLLKQTPQMTITKEFTGKATVIASADGALLLFQRHDTATRYIYSSQEFTTSFEANNSVFPPIGNKKTTQ